MKISIAVFGERTAREIATAREKSAAFRAMRAAGAEESWMWSVAAQVLEQCNRGQIEIALISGERSGIEDN